MKDLKGDERSKEEKEYQHVAEGSEGYIEMLMDANEVVARLQGRLKLIARGRERTKTLITSKERENIVNASVSFSSGGHNIEAENLGFNEMGTLRVNLPKLQLPVFDGNIQQWQEFWDSFSSAIHEQQTLPAVSKFNYLKSVLKGSALSVIAGIPLTSENYTVAVKLLQERFGRKEAIIEALYFKLQSLPKVNNKFAEIQRMSESIEKVLRQLEAQGESINEQRILIQQIISKYPPEVITKLEEAKEPVTPWSMRSLRKAISQYITVQENVQRYVSLMEEVNLLGQDKHDSQRPLNDSQRPSTEALAVNLQREGNQSRASLPCIFCKGSHFNDMCDKYTTLAERRQKLNQQQRCFICLKVGHVAKDCAGAQKKSCCYCGRKGSHNRCVCPQKFTRQETENFMATECSESSENTATVTSNESVKKNNQSTDTVNSSATPMLLASGEKVLLQIQYKK